MNFDTINWSIAKGVHETLPVFIRFRNFDSNFPRVSYPLRLNIFWTITAPTEHGLPSSADSAAMEQFENRLVEAVESDNHSVLSLVLTGKSLREYVFHTSNAQEFLERLSSMPQEEDPYPIELRLTQDDTWDYVDRVLGDIKKD